MNAKNFFNKFTYFWDYSGYYYYILFWDTFNSYNLCKIKNSNIYIISNM